MYNMCSSLFCGEVKGNLDLRWSLQVPTANYLHVLASSCMWWVGLKGIKNALSLEVPPPICNVY